MEQITFDKVGKEYRLSALLELPHPIEVVFNFFANAENLEALTPKFLNFSILTPTPIEMETGKLIDYKIVIHGIPIRWKTRILDWNPPHSFVDEQIRGPYLLWHHTHQFESTANGTLVKDVVRYIPFGGALVHRLFVKKDLERIFGYRCAELRRRFP
jgi:ligand-binding SRPBCC domain-containing protein